MAAFFLLIISLGSLLTTVYVVGYSQRYREQGKKVGLLTAGFNLFLLSMVAVVLANNAYMFLLAWESMALVSYFMLSFEHERSEVRRAGVTYLVVTHLGTAFLIAAFLMLFLAAGQQLSFDAFRGIVQAGDTAVSPMLRDLIFLFTLIGFGTKGV